MNARRGALVVSDGDTTATTLERSASTEEAALTAADRYDQCGACARVYVTLTPGGRLFSCARHGSKHLASIMLKASEILDERHLFLED